MRLRAARSGRTQSHFQLLDCTFLSLHHFEVLAEIFVIVLLLVDEDQVLLVEQLKKLIPRNLPDYLCVFVTGKYYGDGQIDSGTGYLTDDSRPSFAGLRPVHDDVLIGG